MVAARELLDNVAGVIVTPYNARSGWVEKAPTLDGTPATHNDDGGQMSALDLVVKNWIEHIERNEGNAALRELVALRADEKRAQELIFSLRARISAGDIAFAQCNAALTAVTQERDELRAELAEAHSKLMTSDVIELLADIVTPRKCAPDCYRRGWKEAIDAAEKVVYNGVIYPDTCITTWVPGELIKVIRALTPPDSCGDCNPLAPVPCQCDCECLNIATEVKDGLHLCSTCAIMLQQEADYEAEVINLR